MKKRLIRTAQVLILLCVLLLQVCPVSALGITRTYTTEMQTLRLTEYMFQSATPDFSVSHLYGDQLVTDLQKELYAKITQVKLTDDPMMLTISDLPALPPTTSPEFQSELMSFISEQISPAYAAAVEDTPMLFWANTVGYSCSYAVRGDKLISVDIICKVIPHDGFSEYNYNYACNQLENVLQALPFEGTDRVELLRQFHDYLCNTIVYIDSTYAHNIYGALVEGEAVCEGYAKSFKLFCDLYDIPCMILTGTAVTSTGIGPHAWNAVRMEDGNWYGVDVTWDDQNKIYYDFFLIGGTSVPKSFLKITFAESHIVEADFYGDGSVIMQTPTLSAEAYTHTHTYDQGTVTVAPTCRSEGTITYSCTECSVSYSETLPIIDHDYQDGICTMCGASSVVIKYGDCNGDDKINGQDMTRLLRYLANFDYTTGNSTIEIESGADCNGDGTINGKDMTRLLRYLANFDHATGESTIKLGK